MSAACTSCGDTLPEGIEVYAADWTVIEEGGPRMETRYQHISCERAAAGDLRGAVLAVIAEHRGNRSPAYAGASDYVPISALEGLLAASKVIA